MEFFAFFIFIFGLFVGSFLNVIADRLPNGENPFKGRSHCDHCKKTLSAIDLIPVFSYISTGGKCRYCKKKLSLYYPISELITGFLFVIVYLSISGEYEYQLRFILEIAFYLYIASSLIVVFLTDLKYGIIPFSVVAAAVILLYLHTFIFMPELLYIRSIVGLLLFGFLLFIFLITKGRGMGFGDVVFAFFMGFLLGFPKAVLGFYIAVLLGAIIPLTIFVIKKKKIRGATIPFGPFLVTGTIIGLFWGDFCVIKILNYLHLL